MRNFLLDFNRPQIIGILQFILKSVIKAIHFKVSRFSQASEDILVQVIALMKAW